MILSSAMVYGIAIFYTKFSSSYVEERNEARTEKFKVELHEMTLTQAHCSRCQALLDMLYVYINEHVVRCLIYKAVDSAVARNFLRVWALSTRTRKMRKKIPGGGAEPTQLPPRYGTACMCIKCISVESKLWWSWGSLKWSTIWEFRCPPESLNGYSWSLVGP